MTTTSSLTKEAFDRLLRLLDPDPQQAAEEYERLRRLLIEFFRSRKCIGVEDLPDEVFNRVALRLEQDAQIDRAGGFIYGVARKVLLEQCNRAPVQFVPLGSVPELVDPINDPEAILDRAEIEAELEQRLLLTYDCLQALPLESRALLLKYHADAGQVRMKRRKVLAKELGVTMNALRIRVCRIADEVAACVDERLGRARRLGNESPRPSPEK